MKKIVIDIRSKIVYIMTVACGIDRGKDAPGCSAVWLAHVLWEHGAGGSNPFTPTNSFCTQRGPVVKRPKTSPFHGGNSGSNPDGVTLFFLNWYGPLAQLVRAAGS